VLAKLLRVSVSLPSIKPGPNMQARKDQLEEVVRTFFKEYQKTSKQIKLIDAFLVYVMATGVLQFLYVALVGQFPFNSFLSGFISSIGLFVLTGKSPLRVFQSADNQYASFISILLFLSSVSTASADKPSGVPWHLKTKSLR